MEYVLLIVAFATASAIVIESCLRQQEEQERAEAFAKRIRSEESKS